MKNTLGVNIAANYFGKIWGFISVYLFVPIYINILGIEYYAIINFYTLLLSIMLIADAGLSATLSREIARSDDKVYLGNLLRTIEYLYLIISFAVFAGIFVFSEFIARNWLNAENIPHEKLVLYIKMMGGCISFQLLTILYNSGLMGLQKQVLSNTIQIFSSLFRQGLVLLPLFFFKTLDTFFIWQLSVNVVFLFISRYTLWKFIRIDIMPVFKWNILKTIGGFTIGMMIMAVISALNTQIDKILVSNLLSLKVFGYYALAGILAQSTSMLILPIAVALLPKMTRFAEEKALFEQQDLFHKYSFIIASLGCAVTMVLFLYTKDFIFIWTHDDTIVANATDVAKILLIGGLFLSLQYMPYHLAIANGHTKTNIVLGVVVVILIVPALYLSIGHYGLIGATFPWLTLNFIAAFYLGYFVIKKFLNGNFYIWLIKDTMIPISVSLVLGSIAYYFTIEIVQGYNVLLIGGFVGLVNLLICALIYSKLYLHSSIKNIFNIYVK